MPAISTFTYWQKRVSEFCAANNIQKSKSAQRRIAARIHERAKLVSPLIYLDPTGEEAVHNVLTAITTDRSAAQ